MLRGITKPLNSGSNFGADALLLLLTHFSCVRLCATPETAAHQAPPSLGFSRQEHWSGLPFPPPMHESEKWKWKVKVKSLSHVQLLATPWTAAYQAPPSMGFSRQEYWSGLPLPSPYKATMPPTKSNLKNKMLNRTKAKTDVWSVWIYFGDLGAVDFSPVLPTTGSPSTGYGCSDCTGLSVFCRIHKGRMGGCWNPRGQDDGVWEFPECCSPHSNYSPRQGLAQETFTLSQVRCLSESIGPACARVQLNSNNQSDWTTWIPAGYSVMYLTLENPICSEGPCLVSAFHVGSPSFLLHILFTAPPLPLECLHAGAWTYFVKNYFWG